MERGMERGCAGGRRDEDVQGPLRDGVGVLEVWEREGREGLAEPAGGGASVQDSGGL